MKPEILVFDSSAALSKAAAEHFSRVIWRAVNHRQVAYVALSGGGTPMELYRLLAKPPYCDGLPWESIHFFWGDERCVPPDDPESNYGQAYHAFLQAVAVPPENIHRVRGELEPAAAAADYIAQLKALAVGGLDWPRFDWVLMGMGSDGHTASLFPGKVNPSESALPALAVSGDYEGRPANRVTLTPLVFNAARSVVFLVTGQNKAHAVADVLQGPPDPLNLPAQRIQPDDGLVTWMIDQPASAMLKSED